MTSRSTAFLSSRSPTTLLLILAISSRLIHLTILHILSRFLPLFDTSPLLLSGDDVPSPLLRWDAIHFASIASKGYEYEQQLAFQPGWMGVMRLAGEGVRWIKAYIRAGEGGVGVVRVEDVLIGGTVISNMAFVGATLVLYKLTAHLYTPTFAFLASLLYLIPPTPIPSVPYTEPIYALFAFTGFYLLVVKKQYISASLFLAGGTSVRATGVINALGLIWYSLFGDGGFMAAGELTAWDSLKRFTIGNVRSYVPTIIVIAPFMTFQWYADRSFCTNSARLAGQWRPWCDVKPPISYAFVQKEYWNIGLFNYWTLSQMPNILLASPVLLVSIYGTLNYLRKRVSSGRHTNPSHPALEGLYICHLVTTCLLLFSSHTQIALRVCLGDPVVWWNVVSLAFDWDKSPDGKQMGRRGMTKVGKWWVGWCLVWGAVSMVLWVGHYPPA
ncbi:hypothetical protein IAR55_001020 [Kwoniella newhampshirensis]|uniref:GPI mannosyltransferase 2 n=1 Tax=Kwoniella newhampshirensis TaxID=1651941 RepID=A0AAW0Z4J2_9TREE